MDPDAHGEVDAMASAELEQVRSLWQGLLAALAPPADMPEWRAGYDKFCASFPIPGDATIEEVDAGGTPALLVTAAGASPDTVVLWSHSGGYCFGSARGYRSFGVALSAGSGGQVLLLDYRLAPEHPYPAALQDAKGAYRWLLSQGRDPHSIVIGGDSAGGGLAAATLLALKDDGDLMPAGGLLVSPLTDLTLSGGSMKTRAGVDPIASEAMLGLLGGMYAGEVALDSRYLSPALADIGGLPPLLVLVGTDEVLYDDSVRLVEGVRARGGEARLVVGVGQFHIWPLFAPILPEGREAIDGMGEFVRATTRSSVSS